MFKFNFSADDDHLESSTYSHEGDTLQWAKATEISVTREQISNIDTSASPLGTFVCENRSFSYLLPDVTKELKDVSIALAESQHSDLVPGKYEGGFKIWECTYDLASYMLGKVLHLLGPGVPVLDLGCGTGMLGIIALKQGCSVHFQDYNSSVLSAMTVPNILLNNSEDVYDKLLKCRFFSGDWESFAELTDTEDIKYDVIVTSETIYNPNNYPKLHSIFQKRLNKTGVIFLAAKTHYFGVGGGLRQFESFIQENNTFSYTNCWKCKEGVQREILRLEHIQNDKE